MHHFKPTCKKVFCISGVVAMLCLLVMLLRTGDVERSFGRQITSPAISTTPAEITASFGITSTIHKSVANRSNHCHFSLRNKSFAKLLLGKASSFPSLSLLSSTAQPSCYLCSYSSFISPPGYILFLFRYALF